MTKTLALALLLFGGAAVACPHHDEGNAPKTVKTEKKVETKKVEAPAKTDTAKSDAKAPAKADAKKTVDKKPA